jgi:hypothetical protein
MADQNQPSDHQGQSYEISDQHKWQGQELGVNSEVPLMDEGKGKPYIVRQWVFHFNPEILQKIRQNKIPAPTKQELFNSNWRQIQLQLWGDGLVATEMVEPRIIIGKKKYRIILLCEPKFRTLVVDKPRTLQDLMKPVTLKSIAKTNDQSGSG